MSLNNVYGKGNAGKLAWPVTGHPTSNVSSNLELQDGDKNPKDSHSRIKSEEQELERKKQKLKRYSRKLKQQQEELRKQQQHLIPDNQPKEIIIVNRETQDPDLTNEELKILAVNGGIGDAFQNHKSKDQLIKDLLLEAGIHNNIQKEKIQEILSFNNNNNSLSLSDIISSLGGGIWNNDQNDRPMRYYPNGSGPYYPNGSGPYYPNGSGPYYPNGFNPYPNGFNPYPNGSGPNYPNGSGPYYPNVSNPYPNGSNPYPDWSTPYPNRTGSCYPNRTGSCYPNRTGSCYPNRTGSYYPRYY